MKLTTMVTSLTAMMMTMTMMILSLSSSSSSCLAFLLPSSALKRSTLQQQRQRTVDPSFFSRSSSLAVAVASTTTTTTTLPEGIIKTINNEGNGEKVKVGDIVTLKYSCYVTEDTDGSSKSSSTVKPFAKATKQKVVVGEGTMISGWDSALKTMTKGERAIVRVIDPSLAYGTQGIPALIPPNSPLELDLEVLDIQPPGLNIDFDSFAMADNTPRTASEIAAAYEQRLQAKALQSGPKKEGLEAFIEKAKNFYFFGFFEGETGQQAPWFLRPSITFPIAFLIVGAAFYISYISGAISERGASSVDELDEIILQSTLLLLINTLSN